MQNTKFRLPYTKLFSIMTVSYTHLDVYKRQSVARQLLKENRIDKLWLSVIPTVLGKGVRLFPGLHRELPLKLVATEHYNGIVDLVYEKR